MKIGKKVGHKMKILDLGGGFPAGQLGKNQIEVLNETKSDTYRVVAEPGRHFS